MKKITVGPRLSDEAAKWYESNFDTRGGGAEFILEAFPILYKRTLGELRGKFSAGEISLLIDTFNSTMITPRLLGQSLELCADDSMRLDRSHNRVAWGGAGPVTDTSGYYSAFVGSGWSGTVTPRRTGCSFSPDHAVNRSKVTFSQIPPSRKEGPSSLNRARNFALSASSPFLWPSR